MDEITVNGYIGGVLSAIMILPQLYRIYQTGSVNDISWTFVILSIVASIFSLAYYIEIRADPMTYTNVFSLVTRIVLAILKIYFREKHGESELRAKFLDV